MDWLLDPLLWPVWFICVAMIASAVIDGWKYKVPNWLTFPVILSGWALGILHNFDLHLWEDGLGGFGASFACTMLACVLLYPFYLVKWVGAGDVKMQMGFGAWIGPLFGMRDGLWVVLYAYMIGVLVGGVIGLIIILVRGNYQETMQNTRAILLGVASGSVGKIAEKGTELRAKRPFPYGIPLCIGFLAYLWYLFNYSYGTGSP